jgi:hypothetical protein
MPEEYDCQYVTFLITQTLKITNSTCKKTSTPIDKNTTLKKRISPTQKGVKVSQT